MAVPSFNQLVELPPNTSNKHPVLKLKLIGTVLLSPSTEGAGRYLRYGVAPWPTHFMTVSNPRSGSGQQWLGQLRPIVD